jgi:DNA-binding NtrC family response regulator
MATLFRRIRQVASSDATVFLSGETGTGKELVARALHELSQRRQAPFVALNCGAMSATLIESELFGHEQGSFTGADRRHHGVFAQADGGTLLLDEITEMDLAMQVRLLRVLETRTFHRIGGERPVHADVRLIAAANRDPLAAIRAGRLREDLYYRLMVFPIRVPPLRERGDDIEQLAQHFLAAHNRQAVTAKAFAPSALARLRSHPWPGNVRELRHLVHRLFLTADGDIDAVELDVAAAAPGDPTAVPVTIGMSLATAERHLIGATLSHCGGKKGEAARVLGISLKTLYARLGVYAAAAHAVLPPA